MSLTGDNFLCIRQIYQRIFFIQVFLLKGKLSRVSFVILKRDLKIFIKSLQSKEIILLGNFIQILQLFIRIVVLYAFLSSL